MMSDAVLFREPGYFSRLGGVSDILDSLIGIIYHSCLILAAPLTYPTGYLFILGSAGSGHGDIMTRI